MPKPAFHPSLLIDTLHRLALTALPSGQLHLDQSMHVTKPHIWLKKYFFYKRFATLKFQLTHPPHVLVSAKVLLQSRRAKGGFSFGAEACHA